MMSNLREWDALVIGCGPSGSAAAAMLARAGRNVLAIDKADFPREKPCGDGVLSDAYPELQRIGVWDAIRAANFRPFTGLRLVPEGKPTLTLPLVAAQQELSFLAPRTVFDTILRDHAAACGAEVRHARAIEPLWQDGQIVGVLAEENGQRVELRARVVIAADGAASVVASKTRRNTAESKAVALRGYVETEHELDNYLQINLYKQLGLGYAWLFPLGPHLANVGLGLAVEDSRGQDRPLRELLEEYVNSEPIRAILGKGELHEVQSWTLNLLRDDSSRVLPGALLVGDAGGYVNPATGAGISNALLTGRVAGEVAAEALAAGADRQAVLASYDQRSQAELEERMQLSRDLEHVLRVLVTAGVGS
jgi:geranylgeranyl reductase family protein